MAELLADSGRTRRSPEERRRGRATDSRQPLPDRRNERSRQRLLDRVRSEFAELPGLTLTLPQAQRLFGVRRDVCVRVLHALVDEGILRITADGGCERADRQRSLPTDASGLAR
jgi:hypothetical protein